MTWPKLIIIVLITIVVIASISSAITYIILSSNKNVKDDENKNNNIINNMAEKQMVGSQASCLVDLNIYKGYLDGNLSLTQRYNNGTYGSVVPPFGQLDAAINTLFTDQRNCISGMAVCTNFPNSTFSSISLNSSSCSECVSAYGTCK